MPPPCAEFVGVRRRSIGAERIDHHGDRWLIIIESMVTMNPLLKHVFASTDTADVSALSNGLTKLNARERGLGLAQVVRPDAVCKYNVSQMGHPFLDTLTQRCLGLVHHP